MQAVLAGIACFQQLTRIPLVRAFASGAPDLVGTGDVPVLLGSDYFPLSSARVRSDSQTASIASMELVATAAPSRRWVSL